MKKIAMICLASLLACSSVVACGGRGGATVKVDKTKTQLNITTFEGGYGIGWLEAVRDRFESQYANTSFEEGKMGVQIHLKEDRNLTNESLITDLAGSDQEIYFTEAVNYYDLQARGLLYDLSDVVTGTIPGETGSIQGKMRDVHKEYFQTDDGKYYGIPFYEANYGIVYDIDLFEDELLYFAAEGKGDANGFVRTEKTERSAGPDGQTGTSDDGLPATYEDFFKLCDNMVTKGITPITWTGKNPHYVNTIVEALQADYEGEEQMRINYTFTGTATNLVESINDDGTLSLYSEEITPENGYLTWTKQAGRYYGLKFVETLIANEKYYSKKDVISEAYEHVDAQNAFITGKFIDGNPTIGMLIDGSWWHNEASEMFKAAGQRFGQEVASAKARKFGFMPLPKATADKVGEEYTIVECNNSICFVNGNVDKKKAAVIKEFIQFCHTNVSLAEFTSLTYTCKPFDYTMTTDEVSAMPYWGQELYRLHNEAKFISTYSENAIYKSNANKFTQHYTGEMFKSTVGKLTYNVVPTAMIEDKISAKDYFNGLATYLTASKWSSEYIPVSAQ